MLQLKLNYFPLFFFMGARIKISADYKHIELSLPYRWYLKNNNSVLFGGAMSALSDPFPSIVFEKIIPGCKAWNKSHSIRYVRPAQSKVTARIEIKNDELIEMQKQLTHSGHTEKTFRYYFKDDTGAVIAKVYTRTYLTY